jgi:RNA polymerase sigma-70 factor, ECF subfamily
LQDEKELVRLAQQKDQVAFTQLYENYFNRIYRYIALKTGNQTEAEDMTQQVFLKAMKSISSFKWQGVPFSSWLFRIAHNEVVDYIRKRVKARTVPLEETWAEHLGEESDAPEDIAQYNLDVEQLNLAVKKLTRAQEEVITMRFAGELSLAEVALATGKSVNAVKALQHSAVLALRRIMLVEGHEGQTV